MAVTGLTGLASIGPTENDSAFATPQDRMGFPVNPYHSHPGEAAKPYSWESPAVPRVPHQGPIGANAEMIGDEDWFWEDAGHLSQDPLAAHAPWTHAGPWPKDPIGDQSESPDNIARQLMQNFRLRTVGKRDQARTNIYSRNFAMQDKWVELWEVNPGESDLERPGPQLRSGMAPGGVGGTDRTQSNANQNSYDYASKHMHRRYAAGSIPGNYMWMKPGGRPMIKGLPGPARPAIGPNSPFHGDDLGSAFAYDNGAVLQDSAHQYSAPPEPYVAPPLPQTAVTDATDDWDWGY